MTQRSMSGKRWHGVAIVIAVGLAAVGSAIAAAGFVQENKGGTVDSARVEGALVNCKPGAKVVSGGFSSPPGRNFAQVYPFVSRPDDSNTWEVRVNNRRPRDSAFKAYAICKGGRGQFNGRGKADEVLPGKVQEAVARCRQGERVVGGGFSIPRDPDGSGAAGFPLVSRPFGNNGWEVRVDSNITDPFRFKAYAMCMEGGRGFEEENKGGTAAAGKVRDVTAECRPGGRIVAGGFSTPPNGLFLIPIVSRPTGGDGWEVRVVNPYGGDAEYRFKAYAICTG